MKPSARPRYRYVLFAVEPSDRAPSRSDLIQLLRANAPPELDAWLTRYEGGLGILRVARGTERAARRFLDGFAASGMTIRPRLTSGTIAGLERRLQDGKLGRGRRERG